jgi:hypothetical protein
VRAQYGAQARIRRPPPCRADACSQGCGTTSLLAESWSRISAFALSSSVSHGIQPKVRKALSRPSNQRFLPLMSLGPQLQSARVPSGAGRQLESTYQPARMTLWCVEAMISLLRHGRDHIPLPHRVASQASGLRSMTTSGISPWAFGRSIDDHVELEGRVLAKI